MVNPAMVRVRERVREGVRERVPERERVRVSACHIACVLTYLFTEVNSFTAKICECILRSLTHAHHVLSQSLTNRRSE